MNHDMIWVLKFLKLFVAPPTSSALITPRPVAETSSARTRASNAPFALVRRQSPALIGCNDAFKIGLNFEVACHSNNFKRNFAVAQLRPRTCLPVAKTARLPAQKMPLQGTWWAMWLNQCHNTWLISPHYSPNTVPGPLLCQAHWESQKDTTIQTVNLCLLQLGWPLLLHHGIQFGPGAPVCHWQDKDGKPINFSWWMYDGYRKDWFLLH